MNEKSSLRVLNSRSGNLKSQIQNRKWGGIVAIVVTFTMCEAVAQAQQPAKVPRIGYLDTSGDSSTPSPRLEAFRQGLQDVGFFEGKNVLAEYRYAEGKLDRVP